MSVGVSLAQLISALNDAMAAEGVSPYKRQRVVNRMVWGHPLGFQQAQPNRDDVLDPDAGARVREVEAWARSRPPLTPAEEKVMREQAPDIYTRDGRLVTLGPASVRTGVADDGTTVAADQIAVAHAASRATASLIASQLPPQPEVRCRYCGQQIEQAAAQRGRAGWATTDLNIDGPWYCKSAMAPDHRHEPLGEEAPRDE